MNRFYLFAIILVFSTGGSAQDTVIDTRSAVNLGSYLVAAPNARIAQAFTTGPNPAPFHSLSFHFLNSLDPIGEAEVFLMSGDGNIPTTIIENLGNVLTDDASSGGPTLESKEYPLLLANTRYWIVARELSGRLRWAAATQASLGSATGSGTIDLLSLNSTDDGQTWTAFTNSAVAKIAVFALPVRMVTSSDDDGPGSLRDAIANAAGDSAIFFSPSLSGGTIRLTGGRLDLNDLLVIDASALAGGITISGDATGDGPTDDDTQIFFMAGGSTAVLGSLTIADGYPRPGFAGGGGISASFGTSLVVKRSTFRGNRARDGSSSFPNGGFGGAISANGAVNVAISDSLFLNNRAGNGHDESGGVAGIGGSGGAISKTGGSIMIRNSTFSGNRAGDGGDGLAVAGGSGGWGGAIATQLSDVTLQNLTIFGNEAGSPGSGVGTPPLGGRGGGFGDADSTLRISQSVFAGNRIGANASGVNVSVNQSTISFEGVSFVSDNSGGIAMFPNPTGPGQTDANGNFVGTAASPLDPKLGLLADNGGPTLTFFPQADSPLIDPPGALTTSPLSTDQRGFPRVGYDRVDIGAVEFTPADQARFDALAAGVARQAALLNNLDKLKRQLKAAKRKKQVSRIKKIREKQGRIKRLLQAL